MATKIYSLKVAVGQVTGYVMESLAKYSLSRGYFFVPVADFDILEPGVIPSLACDSPTHLTSTTMPICIVSIIGSLLPRVGTQVTTSTTFGKGEEKNDIGGY